MWLFHPQYWVFEALLLFVMFLLIFRWFHKSQSGRRVARSLTLNDSTEEIAQEADEIRDLAASRLGDAEQEAARATRNAQTLRRASGLSDAQK